MKLYLFANELSLRALREGCIPLVAADALSDPFLDAGLPNLEQARPAISNAEFRQELQRQYDALSEDMRSMVTFDYFVQEASRRRKDIEAAMQNRQRLSPLYIDPKLQKVIGVARLFLDIGQPSVWGEMGNRHQGIALELESEAAELHAPSYHEQPQFFGPVHYSDERPLQTFEDTARSGVQERFRPLFVRSSGYRDQDEWRLVRPLASAAKQTADSDNARVGLYKFPVTALTGIVFGCRTAETDMEHLVSMLKVDIRYRHVRLWRLRKDPVRYEFHRVAREKG